MTNPNGPNDYIPPRPDFENNYPIVDIRHIIRTVPPVSVPNIRPQPSLGDLVQEQHDLHTARDLAEREEIVRDAIHRRRETTGRGFFDATLQNILEEMQTDADMTAQEVARAGLAPTRIERVKPDPRRVMVQGSKDLRLHELFTDNVGPHKFQRKVIDPVYLAPSGQRGLFVTSHGFSEQMSDPDLIAVPMDKAFRKHAFSRGGRNLHVEEPRGIYEAGKAYIADKAVKHLTPGEARILKVRTALARLILDAQNKSHADQQRNNGGGQPDHE